MLGRKNYVAICDELGNVKTVAVSIRSFFEVISGNVSWKYSKIKNKNSRVMQISNALKQKHDLLTTLDVDNKPVFYKKYEIL